jgi:ADP-ribose pyrophosphatase YjhB (NUDIX family)
MAKERHKAVPASYLILIKGGKILMQRRFNTGYMDGYYSLPAGHVDKGENFSECCVRESKEEVGVIVKLEDLKVAHVMHRNSTPEYDETNNRIDIFFTTDKWSGDVEIKEPDKCDDLNWFSLDNLPQNTIPYVRQAIDCFKKVIFYSEMGWEM